MIAVGKKLVEHCKKGTEAQGLKELYSKDAVSVEASLPPGQKGSRRTVGIAGIKGKHDWWYGAHTVHSSKAEGPFYHGANRFAVIFDIDVTNKAMKQRMQMREVGIYTVKDGKITKEEFFYSM
jgi:ketosteroid isomerase-like protein